MMILAAMTAALLAAAPADAAGLRTKFGEVVVKGLKIGQTYSLKQLVNLPYAVVNTGDDEVELLVDSVPATDDVRKTGYETVPSTGWVTLDQTRFTVAPNREVATDIVVRVPNDAALLGRRFEADIWARTRSPRGMYAVGMRSRLLIHVDSVPPTEDEAKKAFVNPRLANLDFTLLPTNGSVEDVPLGVRLDLSGKDKAAGGRKATIKIINPNEQALHFRVRSIPNWESLLSLPEGYEDAYNPQWLKPSKDVVEVAGNSIVETGLVLEIPDLPENRGKKFFFAVGVEVLEAEISTRVYYKLYAHTRAADAKAAPEAPAKPAEPAKALKK